MAEAAAAQAQAASEATSCSEEKDDFKDDVDKGRASRFSWLYVVSVRVWLGCLSYFGVGVCLSLVYVLADNDHLMLSGVYRAQRFFSDDAYYYSKQLVLVWGALGIGLTLVLGPVGRRACVWWAWILSLGYAAVGLRLYVGYSEYGRFLARAMAMLSLLTHVLMCNFMFYLFSPEFCVRKQEFVRVLGFLAGYFVASPLVGWLLAKGTNENLTLERGDPLMCSELAKVVGLMFFASLLSSLTLSYVFDREYLGHRGCGGCGHLDKCKCKGKHKGEKGKGNRKGDENSENHHKHNHDKHDNQGIVWAPISGLSYKLVRRSMFSFLNLETLVVLWLANPLISHAIPYTVGFHFEFHRLSAVHRLVFGTVLVTVVFYAHRELVWECVEALRALSLAVFNVLYTDCFGQIEDMHMRRTPISTTCIPNYLDFRSVCEGTAVVTTTTSGSVGTTTTSGVAKGALVGGVRGGLSGLGEFSLGHSMLKTNSGRQPNSMTMPGLVAYPHMDKNWDHAENEDKALLSECWQMLRTVDSLHNHISSTPNPGLCDPNSLSHSPFSGMTLGCHTPSVPLSCGPCSPIHPLSPGSPYTLTLDTLRLCPDNLTLISHTRSVRLNPRRLRKRLSHKLWSRVSTSNLNSYHNPVTKHYKSTLVPVTGSNYNPHSCTSNHNSKYNLMPGLALSVYEVVREFSLKLSTLLSVSVSRYKLDLLTYNSYNRQIADLSGDLSYGSSPKDDLNYLFYFTYFAEYKSHPYYDDFTRIIVTETNELQKCIESLDISFDNLKATVTDIHTNIVKLLYSILIIGTSVQESISKSTEHINSQIKTNQQKMEDSVTQIEQNITQINSQLREYINGELAKIVQQFKVTLRTKFTGFYSVLQENINIIQTGENQNTINIDSFIFNEINQFIALAYFIENKGNFKYIDYDNIKMYLTTLNEKLRNFRTEIDELKAGTLKSVDELIRKNKPKNGSDSHNQITLPLSEGSLTYRNFDTNKDDITKYFDDYIQILKDGYVQSLKEKKKKLVSDYNHIKKELEKLVSLKLELQESLNWDRIYKNSQTVDELNRLIKHKTNIDNLIIKFDKEIPTLEKGLETFVNDQNISTNLNQLKSIKDDNEILKGYNTQSQTSTQTNGQNPLIQTIKDYAQNLSHTNKDINQIKTNLNEFKNSQYSSNVAKIKGTTERLLSHKKITEKLENISSDLGRVSISVNSDNGKGTTNTELCKDPKGESYPSVVKGNDAHINTNLKSAIRELCNVKQQLGKLERYKKNIENLDKIAGSVDNLNNIKAQIEEIKPSGQGKGTSTKPDKKSPKEKLTEDRNKLENAIKTLDGIGKTVHQLVSEKSKLSQFTQMEENVLKLKSSYKSIEKNNTGIEIINDSQFLESLQTQYTEDTSALNDIYKKMIIFPPMLNQIITNLKQYLSEYQKNNSEEHPDKSEIEGIKKNIEELIVDIIKAIVDKSTVIKRLGQKIKGEHGLYLERLREFREQIDKLYHCIDYVVKEFLECSLRSTICILNLLNIKMCTKNIIKVYYNDIRPNTLKLINSISHLYHTFHTLQQTYTQINCDTYKLHQSITRLHKSLIPKLGSKLDSIVHKINLTIKHTNEQTIQKINQETENNKNNIDDSVTTINKKIPMITSKLQEHVTQTLKEINQRFKERVKKALSIFYTDFEYDVRFIDKDGNTIKIDQHILDKINSWIKVIKVYYGYEELQSVNEEELKENIKTINEGLKGMRDNIEKLKTEPNDNLSLNETIKSEYLDTYDGEKDPFGEYIITYREKIKEVKDISQNKVEIKRGLEKLEKVEKELQRAKYFRAYVEENIIPSIKTLPFYIHRIEQLLYKIDSAIGLMKYTIKYTPSQLFPIKQELKELSDIKKTKGKLHSYKQELKAGKTTLKDGGSDSNLQEFQSAVRELISKSDKIKMITSTSKTKKPGKGQETDKSNSTKLVNKPTTLPTVIVKDELKVVDNELQRLEKYSEIIAKLKAIKQELEIENTNIEKHTKEQPIGVVSDISGLETLEKELSKLESSNRSISAELKEKEKFKQELRQDKTKVERYKGELVGYKGLLTTLKTKTLQKSTEISGFKPKLHQVHCQLQQVMDVGSTILTLSKLKQNTGKLKGYHTNLTELIKNIEGLKTFDLSSHNQPITQLMDKITGTLTNAKVTVDSVEPKVKDEDRDVITIGREKNKVQKEICKIKAYTFQLDHNDEMIKKEYYDYNKSLEQLKSSIDNVHHSIDSLTKLLPGCSVEFILYNLDTIIGQTHHGHTLYDLDKLVNDTTTSGNSNTNLNDNNTSDSTQSQSGDHSLTHSLSTHSKDYAMRQTLVTKSSNLSQHISEYYFLLLGHYSTIDSTFTVSKLYKYSVMINKILHILIVVNVCCCESMIKFDAFKKLFPGITSINLANICGIVFPNFHYVHNEFKHWKFHPRYHREIIDNQGNHLCLCLVIKYQLYPNLIRCLCYLVDMELDISSKIIRNMDKYSGFDSYKADISKLSILVIEICYKLCAWMRTRYLCDCKNRDSNKCCCDEKKKCPCYSKTDLSNICSCNCFCNNKDKYTPWFINVIIWIICLIENLFNLNNSHIQQALQHMSNLYNELNHIDCDPHIPKVIPDSQLQQPVSQAYSSTHSSTAQPSDTQSTPVQTKESPKFKFIYIFNYKCNGKNHVLYNFYHDNYKNNAQQKLKLNDLELRKCHNFHSVDCYLVLYMTCKSYTFGKTYHFNILVPNKNELEKNTYKCSKSSFINLLTKIVNLISSKIITNFTLKCIFKAKKKCKGNIITGVLENILTQKIIYNNTCVSATKTHRMCELTRISASRSGSNYSSKSGSNSGRTTYNSGSNYRDYPGVEHTELTHRYHGYDNLVRPGVSFGIGQLKFVLTKYVGISLVVFLFCILKFRFEKLVHGDPGYVASGYLGCHIGHNSRHFTNHVGGNTRGHLGHKFGGFLGPTLPLQLKDESQDYVPDLPDNTRNNAELPSFLRHQIGLHEFGDITDSTDVGDVVKDLYGFEDSDDTCFSESGFWVSPNTYSQTLGTHTALTLVGTDFNSLPSPVSSLPSTTLTPLPTVGSDMGTSLAPVATVPTNPTALTTTTVSPTNPPSPGSPASTGKPSLTIESMKAKLKNNIGLYLLVCVFSVVCALYSTMIIRHLFVSLNLRYGEWAYIINLFLVMGLVFCVLMKYWVHITDFIRILESYGARLTKTHSFSEALADVSGKAGETSRLVMAYGLMSTAKTDFLSLFLMDKPTEATIAYSHMKDQVYPYNSMDTPVHRMFSKPEDYVENLGDIRDNVIQSLDSQDSMDIGNVLDFVSYIVLSKTSGFSEYESQFVGNEKFVAWRLYKQLSHNFFLISYHRYSAIYRLGSMLKQLKMEASEASIRNCQMLWQVFAELETELVSLKAMGDASLKEPVTESEKQALVSRFSEEYLDEFVDFQLYILKQLCDVNEQRLRSHQIDNPFPYIDMFGDKPLHKSDVVAMSAKYFDSTYRKMVNTMSIPTRTCDLTGQNVHVVSRLRDFCGHWLNQRLRYCKKLRSTHCENAVNYAHDLVVGVLGEKVKAREAISKLVTDLSLDEVDCMDHLFGDQALFEKQRMNRYMEEIKTFSKHDRILQEYYYAGTEYLRKYVISCKENRMNAYAKLGIYALTHGIPVFESDIQKLDNLVNLL